MATKKKQRRLPVDVKRFIVMELACFRTPSQVAAAVKDEFGLEVGRQLVSSYDPATHQGRKLGKEWRALRERTRTTYLQRKENIGVANQLVRLTRMEEQYDRFERQIAELEATKGPVNRKLIAELVEKQRAILVDAAKEEGGAFTNRQRLEHEVAGGVLVVPAPISTQDWAAAAQAQQSELAKHRASV